MSNEIVYYPWAWCVTLSLTHPTFYLDDLVNCDHRSCSKDDEWLYNKNITFEPSAPAGYLPIAWASWWFLGLWKEGKLCVVCGLFFSRVETCLL